MARVPTDPQLLREVREGTAWRREPLGRRIAFARREGIAVAPGSAPDEVDAALERAMGESDLLPALWLREAARVADAVARIEAPLGEGTGFLVSPDLLLTNNHVLPEPDHADSAVVRFRYEQDVEGLITGAKRHRLQPDRFFSTSPRTELDYTLVAVSPTADGQPAGATYGVIALIGVTGKILLGQPVNIIQHPDGDPRQIAIRNNALVSVDDKRKITYLTDTERGSSGSPVFNDRWECVALHHSSVSARDAQGREIDINGSPVTRDTPDQLRKWIANEGIRVSALVADIEARAYPAEQRALVDALLAQGEQR